MMVQNNVDSPSDLSYNVVNDENVAIVKMEEQKPVNDTSCRHEKLIPEPKDTIGNAVYHGCANYKCGVGFYIRINEDNK